VLDLDGGVCRMGVVHERQPDAHRRHLVDGAPDALEWQIGRWDDIAA